MWYCCEPRNAAVPGDVLGELTEKGFVLAPHAEEHPSGPGIIFFQYTSEALFDLVSRASRKGRERVLTLAISAEPIGAAVSWRLLECGASDTLTWRNGMAHDVAARFERWLEIDQLVEDPLVQDNLVGRSHAWLSVLRQVVEAARFTDTSVLITGESGTGKELIARLIHTLDARQGKRDLIVLDCTTIVPELSGSEFFGHERGAYTGAVSSRDGLFALADGGTLFLDEVGELPPVLQVQLLRVVQEHTYKRVGGNVWCETSFRLLCATNRSLTEELARGGFRHDFYHRIAATVCHLPPLRERTEDILPLARYFLRQCCPESTDFDDVVSAYLLQRDYPGNVRELRRLVISMGCHHTGPGPITAGDIPPKERPASGAVSRDWCDASVEGAIRRALAMGASLKQIGRRAEEAAEHIAIAESDGNLQLAARKLGVTDRALQMRRAARRGA